MSNTIRPASPESPNIPTYITRLSITSPTKNKLSAPTAIEPTIPKPITATRIPVRPLTNPTIVFIILSIIPPCNSYEYGTKSMAIHKLFYIGVSTVFTREWCVINLAYIVHEH